MKNPINIDLKLVPTLLLGGISLVLLSPDAKAQRPWPAVRRAAGASAIGDPAELAVHRDKFMAFRRTRLVGAGYYTKANFRLQTNHAEVYALIESATVGGRLTEETAREMVGRLILKRKMERSPERGK